MKIVTGNSEIIRGGSGSNSTRSAEIAISSQARIQKDFLKHYVGMPLAMSTVAYFATSPVFYLTGISAIHNARALQALTAVLTLLGGCAGLLTGLLLELCSGCSKNAE